MEHLEKILAYLTSATPATAIFVIAVLALVVVWSALRVVGDAIRRKEADK